LVCAFRASNVKTLSGYPSPFEMTPSASWLPLMMKVGMLARCSSPSARAKNSPV